MPLYRVTWESDIEADTPEEAARQAWQHMRTPDSIANVFDVSDDAETVQIDLTELDQLRADWLYEVQNDYTKRSFEEWCAAKAEEETPA